MFTYKFIKTIGLLLVLWSFNSQGSAIYYDAIDLPDVTIGDDLWQYQYQITGANFQQDQGFDIFFPVNEGYQDGDLMIPTAANGDWFMQAYQPDSLLPHDGFLDGQSLKDNSSLQGYFYIDFIWRGQGTPGKQDYEFYSANFDLINNGQTQPFPNSSVPEPKALLLMLLGLGGFFGFRATRSL